MAMLHICQSDKKQRYQRTIWAFTLSTAAANNNDIFVFV